MSVQLNLSKDALKLELTKKGVEKIPECQVSFQLDVSGSFHFEHKSGNTNKLLQRILPFALLLDKDKKLDMFSFSQESIELKPVTEHNFIDYVKNHVMTASNYNGYSTSYVSGLQSLIENGFRDVEDKKGGFISSLFGFKKVGGVSEKKESVGKHLSFFVTDGADSGNPHTTLNYFLENKTEDHFIIFISIGDYELETLKRNYKGKSYSEYFNMTRQDLNNISDKTDDELFEMFLTPNLIKWANK